MKRVIILALILMGFILSCTNNIERNNEIEIETEADENIDFIDQINDTFIDEEEYIEIGELI